MLMEELWLTIAIAAGTIAIAVAITFPKKEAETGNSGQCSFASWNHLCGSWHHIR
jgi:hypothetical protein